MDGSLHPTHAAPRKAPAGRGRRDHLARLTAALMMLAMAAWPLPPVAAHPEPGRHAGSGAPRDVGSAEEAGRRAPPPIAIRIDAANVNGPVEISEIVDGELAAPSGPWVVAWYRETARPAETGNVVMGGHVDYWTTGPAVFFNLGTLGKGAKIEVTDATGEAYAYAVEWVRAYPVAELTPAQLREIVGPTETPSLTLITCGGAFDASRGEYRMRLVVRASRLEG